MKSPFWNGASKGATISVWLRKNLSSYQIQHSSFSGSWTSLGNTKESKTYCLCTLLINSCRALTFSTLFLSESIWTFGNQYGGSVQVKKNCIENSRVNYLLFSLNSRHKKMLDAVILEHYVEFAESDTPIE